MGLWRSNPQRKVTGKHIAANCFFASGRQALVQAMQELGLSRVNRVAYPEYSSACVITTIGKVASPIPLKEALHLREPVNAVLVYEQWGWPYSRESIDDVSERFPAVILDCVDSPDALWRQQTQLQNSVFPVVISLSKCLGLRQGGLLWQQQWRTVNAPREPELVTQLPPSKGLDLAKTYINSIDAIFDFVDSDIESLLVDEVKARQYNLQTLSDMGLCFDWPKWMLDVVENKHGAPGIAPLFSTFTPEERNQIQASLAEIGVTTEIYNFNFSGHPLKFDYRPCLAFPIHSELVWHHKLTQLLGQMK